jgi:predicted Zn-dependent peptidase
VAHSLRDRAAVLCYSGTSTERAQETLDVLLEQLQQLAHGVQADELQRLQARIKSNLILQQESSGARSAAIAADWYHLGRVRTMDEIRQRVNRLTCDSINDYLRQHPPRDFTVVTLGAQPLEVRIGVS